ncbi:hypothetical protein GGP53_001027 [Salinibacter ruber]|nr:hypothetical protein [Salinibacter ruber]MCS4144093.1 hypothetical protein [Salinibacter ruber]
MRSDKLHLHGRVKNAVSENFGYNDIEVQVYRQNNGKVAKTKTLAPHQGSRTLSLMPRAENWRITFFVQVYAWQQLTTGLYSLLEADVYQHFMSPQKPRRQDQILEDV